MDKPKSLCVLRLSALGDCINAFGVIGALKHTYSELNVAWVLDKRFAALFVDDEGQDIVPMIKADFSKGLFKARADVKRQLKERGMKFDVLLNMQTSVKSSITSTAIKVKDRYGYDSQRSREGQSLFVNKTATSPDNPHVVAGFMSFTKACGYPIAEPYWDFKLSDQLLDKAREYVKDEKTLALCPCSAKANKNWTLEGYIELTKHALNQEMSVVLLGGKTAIERDMCDAISTACPQVLNLCGKTNLRELAAVLSLSKLTVSPDSGSMHLSSALGTPVIGLFARHDDHRVGPWNFMDLNVSIYEKLAQAELKGKAIPWRYRVKKEDAMSLIPEDLVLSVFDKALERYRIL